MEVGKAKPANEWSATMMPDGANCIKVTVNVPKDAIVGRYRVAMKVDSQAGDGQVKVRKYTFGDVIIIFNPFSFCELILLRINTF